MVSLMNTVLISISEFFQGHNRRSTSWPSLIARFIFVLIMVGACENLLSTATAAEPIIITASDFWTGGVSLQSKVQNLAYLDYMKKHPNVIIRSASPGINIPGPAARGSQLMRFVGQVSPDIIYVYLSDIRQYIDQGFLTPLDESVGYDSNGDGVMDESEIKWKEWWQLPQEMRAAATFEGHIYAIPHSKPHITGMCFRRDLFAQAGLDPNAPPKSYDELFYAAQKLTDPSANSGQGRMGLLLEAYPAALWHHGIWDGGGEMVVQVKRRADGKEVTFPMRVERTIDPQTGEDLTKQQPTYRATFNAQAGIATLDFIHRLRWARWVRSPSGEPVNLSPDQLNQIDFNSSVDLLDPKTNEHFVATGKEVNVGVVRLLRDSDRNAESPLPTPFIRGQVAMLFSALDMSLLAPGILPRSAVGLTRLPTPDGKPGSVQSHSQFMAIFSQIRAKPEACRIAQDVLIHRLSETYLIEGARLLANAGDYQSIPPATLRAAGLHDLLSQIDPQTLALFDDLATRLRSEPYNPGWNRTLELFRSEIFDTMFLQEHFDYHAGLENVARIVNTKAYVKPEQLVAPYRDRGHVVVGVIGLLLAIGAIWAGKELGMDMWAKVKHSTNSTSAGRLAGVMPWLLLAPALLLIALWSYYPLARGSLMAFEDYQILKPSRWVGIDHFILILIDPKFYFYCYNTLIFAALTLSIGFATPLFLALLLSEIPQGKVLFRTIFYLPSVTAGLVIMLLWKQMYEPSSQGMLNQLLHIAGVTPRSWLEDPNLAMACVIIPGIWASMGAGSLIYLAALKSIPDEMYEAAEIDGANLWNKITHVTVPMLKPLLVINFVGAFIGAFQGMGNILVMTGGGPADTTRVLALDIWIKSFAQLQFGLATAMAWMLGVMLIGFTVMQLRILNKVDFRRARGV